MIWRTKDYKGNEQVWYSEDVILQIKDIVKNISRFTACDEQRIDKILDLINEESK